ncbi:magnesium transporter CorA family protein [Terribacillus saccharophilus]|uniref:magnesium transporter CorA family protein n=1 Tax=Terribacillus saccharophilus TaxID=361277 RepID=UPI003981D711
MEKHIFSDATWKWLQFDWHGDSKEKAELSRYTGKVSWQQHVDAAETNSLQMDTTNHDSLALWGSLIYVQEADEEEKKHLFHFFVREDTLLTTALDFKLLPTTTEKEILAKMKYATNAIEGFMILLGEIISVFLHKIDQYEVRLHDLLWQVKSHNDTKLLNKIAENRHEILVWKNFLIPFIEVKTGVLEAFGDKYAENMHFKRTSYRFERCQNLVRAYEEEIRGLIDFEDVVSSFRGNEIMKTLTVMTVLFTPVMALGALWGMNFESMPELKWKFGYASALILIVMSTLLVYVFLKAKGWTGDMLKSKKKQKYVD